VTNKSGTVVKSWPKLIENTTSSTPKVMELNPLKFGHVFNNPYDGNCDVLLKPLFE